MAGRRSSLCWLLRLKRKREGSGAAQAQQPEEMQHFQPLQQDPGQDQTEEQSHPHGHFCRAVQRFLKFTGIRRRTPRTTPAELMAEHDTRPTKIKPLVSTALIDHMETSETAVTKHMANPASALADLTAKTDFELIHCTAEPDTAVAGDTSGTENDLMAKADIVPVPIDGTSSSAKKPMDDTENSDTSLTIDTINAETEPTDLMAEDDAMPEGIGSADTMPTHSVIDASNPEFFKEKVVSSVNEMDKDVSRRGEHLHQALPYLQSPQQPLREAAVRFMGVAAWHMKDLQPIMKALEVMNADDCPSYSKMWTAVLSAFRQAVAK